MDNNKFIITISREFGSGGMRVGELLAKELDIPFYDKAIINMAADKSGLSAGFIEKSDENIPSGFFHNLKYASYSSFDTVSYYDAPVTDKVFFAQSSVIKEIAAQGSCVIVGRCADYILRGEPELVRVFIRGSLDDRVRRAVERYDLPGEKAADKIRKIDKRRANYYNYYTSREWGSLDNFDLVINTSFTGVNGAVAVIKSMLNERTDA